jgi:hypothetical protein
MHNSNTNPRLSDVMLKQNKLCGRQAFDIHAGSRTITGSAGIILN